MSLTHRLRQAWHILRTPTIQPTPFNQASPADIEASFRLLLRRQPTSEEQAYFHDLIVHHKIMVQTLVDEILSSEEFLAQQANARKPKLVELPDFQLYIRPNDFFVGAYIARVKAYEPEVTKALRILLRPGQTFVDIGANIGYFTMLGASLVGDAGRVVAFEPNAENCELIELSKVANMFAHVELHAYAVAEKAQVFQLDTAGVGSNGRVIDDSPEAVPGSSPPQPVQAIALDQFPIDLPEIHVIKIDIEGAEPRAIQGMIRTLKRHHPIILFEFAPNLIQMTSHIEPKVLLKQLEQLEYKLARPDNIDQRLTIEEILQTTSNGHIDLVALPT